MADYIEREQVKDELLSWAVCIKHPEHLMREDALHVIDSIPAADVVPVVHGAWKPYRDYFSKRHIGWICTNCSGVQMDLSNGDTVYCPNCGANMDLEGTSND